MRKAARRRVRARTMRGRAGGAKALASPLGESRCPKTSYTDPIYFSFYLSLCFWPGNGLALTMSSALTQPGVPIAKRVFARDASSRAVLLSPRRKAACAEADRPARNPPFGHRPLRAG